LRIILVSAAAILTLFTWACTHGSFASRQELDLSKFARQDLCCAGITLDTTDDSHGRAFGCGQEAHYAYANGAWQRVGEIKAGSGNPSDKLADCSK
jgi:hypothetical protein